MSTDSVRPVAADSLRTRNASRLLAQAEAEATAQPFDVIPHIDIGGLWAGDVAERRQVGTAIRRACVEVGFFYVTGHGVDAGVVDGGFDAARSFFALPAADKTAVSILNSPKMRGYTGLLEENTDPDNDGDLHEAFEIGLELPADDPDGDGDVYGWARNQWPGLAGFRAATLSYYDAMVELCEALYRGFALSLDLQEDFFGSMLDKANGELRYLRYPGQPVPDDNVLGIGAHSDYDCFTVLATDDVSALEILNPAGDWIEAPPVPGTFIVNVGDLLQRWTNDIYRSTMHRAVNRMDRDRYSIPFFSSVNPLEVVDVLPSCQSPERPPRYTPVAAGAYVEALMRDAYGVDAN